MTFPGYEDHDEIKKNFKTVEQAATEGKRIVDYTFLIAAQKELAAKEATDGI
ncbi:hypothetical protein LEM8419_03569 [Neolewinella maritima]|uniref:Uncharacterized protein n=1 Tax=Neolewinella maritima TaxID=1383882 RepID=A0ABM9B5R1_9BACT|nr:hypothetical protein [Neolewinella maritima]CAH1002697.1 hypothetical protein LEM8419_03569 [Neolewinella maritima]